MTSILVTGASSFLGYHVARQLNEQGIRPRVLELPGSRLDALGYLSVDVCAGDLDDAAAVRAACTGAETVLHLAFKVSTGGGERLREEMRRVNVSGTRRLLRAAADAGVRRAVVGGSALAIGVNREPAPLDEAAGQEHAFEIPYARSRRQAELEALAHTTADFQVMSVCPSFTFGPDDPIGAPANKLLQSLMSRRVWFTLPIGAGCLDVRDFASGVLLAAARGRGGERYLLSGENVTMTEVLARAAAIAGVRPPRLTAPTFLAHAAVAALGLVCAVRRRPAPITRETLQIIGRYAWYDTSKAREELGWTSRPLQQTLEDTIAWLRQPRLSPASRVDSVTTS
jgi:dihydroflavonol-4-reductase